MKTARTLAGLLVPALLLAGTAGIPGGHAQPATETAAGGPAATAAKADRRDGRRGARFCSRRAGWPMERMATVVEGLAALDDAQKAAWTEFRKAGEEANAGLRQACEALAGEERPTTGPARLERMEKMLTARLDAVRSVRPAFTAFYRTLDEGQQKALDSLGPGKGRHGRRWRR